MTINGNKPYVIGFSIIVVIIGVVFTYLFSAYSRTEAKVQTYQVQVEDIKGSIGDMKVNIEGIKTDVSWIKNALNKK